MCSESVALFPAGFYDWPYEGCKGKGISGNVRWLEGRWFTAERASSWVLFQMLLSRKSPTLCVGPKSLSWLWSHTRGFSILPFIGFLPHKSLDFWHEQHFWQWGVKSCEIRVQLCNTVCLLLWQTNGWIPNKKVFVASGGVNQKAMRASALSGVLPL